MVQIDIIKISECSASLSGINSEYSDDKIVQKSKRDVIRRPVKRQSSLQEMSYRNLIDKTDRKKAVRKDSKRQQAITQIINKKVANENMDNYAVY